jgi:hypothetical protein
LRLAHARLESLLVANETNELSEEERAELDGLSELDRFLPISMLDCFLPHNVICISGRVPDGMEVGVGFANCVGLFLTHGEGCVMGTGEPLACAQFCEDSLHIGCHQ